MKKKEYEELVRKSIIDMQMALDLCDQRTTMKNSSVGWLRLPDRHLVIKEKMI